MIRAGWPEDRAREKSERDHAALLPDGLATERHLIYAIEDGGERVGTLWLADRDGETGRSLFVFSIDVDAEHRGRGHGRAAMLLAEDVARERGLGSVTLNVFGGNDVARGLYRSLGYEELAVFMKKDL
jgi:ribosomal protein S18 acetylase RimI-like enzyme